MYSKTVVSTAVIILSAILIGGCQFKKNDASQSGASPSPTPKVNDAPQSGASPTSTPEIYKETKAASPSASHVPTTKGGIVVKPKVLGTTVVAPKVSYFDTSFDSLKVTNFPGQELEKELVLYNKSDKEAMYAVRAEQKSGETIPVTVNGSYEATGKILPLSQESVKIKVKSNDQNPNFAYNIVVHFQNTTGQILATKTVRVTAYTPVGDRFVVGTASFSSNSENQSMDVTYKPNASFPIRIENRNQRDLNFTAKVVTSEAAGKFAISAANGSFRTGNWWDTDIHFTDKALDGLKKVDIAFTFTSTNGDGYTDTKILTINIK